MAVMTEQQWGWYLQALNCWKGKEYSQAEHIIAIMKKAGAYGLKVRLLEAYVKRDSQAIVTEVECLLSMLEEDFSAEPGIEADVYSLLGAAFQAVGEGEAARDAFLEASRLDKDFSKKCVEYSNAIFSALAIADVTADDMQELYAGYRELLGDKNSENNSGNYIENNVENNIDNNKKYNSAKMSTASISGGFIIGKNRRCADDIARFVETSVKENTEAFSFEEIVKDNDDKIRIGYLSADFHAHPVAGFLWPLVHGFSRDEFEVYCYNGSAISDYVTEKYMELPDVVWRQVKDKSFGEIADIIRADELDILVDLGGHTSGNMLPVLSYRAAPIQASGLGWIGSTGLKCVDYLLADRFCAPAAENPFYTEKLWQLPRTHFCYHIFKEFPAVGDCPFKKNGYITFGSFNNFGKVTGQQLKLWAEIMRQVPNSHLILKHKLLGSQEGRSLVKGRLLEAGIPLERVDLRGFSADYLEQYGDVDIALDTYPYTGGMTTFEALYMGVPVISLYGETHGRRFGYSMLMNLGMEVMTAKTGHEYVQQAVGLANDSLVLGNLRSCLRFTMEHSFLMDEELYVHDVERTYAEMVDKYLKENKKQNNK